MVDLVGKDNFRFDVRRQDLRYYGLKFKLQPGTLTKRSLFSKK